MSTREPTPAGCLTAQRSEVRTARASRQLMCSSGTRHADETMRDQRCCDDARNDETSTWSGSPGEERTAGQANDRSRRRMWNSDNTLANF